MTEREDLEFAERIAEPLREPEAVEPAFEARLLSAVRAAAGRGEAPWTRARRPRRSLGWLVARRQLSLSPLAGLALAAGFAALVAATTLAMTGERRIAAPADRHLVHFAIVAPAANAVTLVGDFNAWDRKTTPMAKGAVEGLWLVTVPLSAGSYQYAFVVDDTTWLADPAAPVALEDEFGTPSSILTIRGGRT
jgi:Carbohydrate-binding module 48 (Isoamylase N-terminal domain)